MRHGLCCLLLLATCAAAQGPRVYWLSPTGDDTAAGDEAHPWATLTGARDRLRALRAALPAPTPVIVQLKGGVYPLAEPVVFGPDDGGTAAAPVRWEAAPGETPVLSGGRALTGWTAVGPRLYRAEAPEIKAGWVFRQLFVGRPGQGWQRRYRPDRGAYLIAGLTDSPTKPGVTMAHRQSQRDFRFHPEDWAGIESTEDIEVVALHDWSASRMRIESLDRERAVVTFTDFPVYRIGHWYQGGRNPYFLENVAAALAEQPGRFHVDRAAGTVTYHALPGEEPTALSLIAPVTEQLVLLRGDLAAGRFVEHFQLAGLTFAHTAWTLPAKGYSSGQGMIDLPAAVDAAAAREILIEGCTFAHTGGYGLKLGEGCARGRVSGNRFFDLGGGGIMVGTTDRGATEPKLPVEHDIGNNVLVDGGLMHYSAHGIWLGVAARCRVHHNYLARWPYSGVSFGWTWGAAANSTRDNVLEYNEIQDAMTILADGGGFYSLGNQPGSVLRGNHIHHIHRSKWAGRAENNAIFFDEGSRGFHLEGNLLHSTVNKIIRYNQSQEGWMTWGENWIGITPDQPGFPRDKAALAGLEPAFAGLLKTIPETPPTPLQAMSVPTGPFPIVDDFERGRPGAKAAHLTLGGEDEALGAVIRITDEVALSGRQSLKYVDAPGMPKPFYPYCWYTPGFAEGLCTVKVAVRLEPGAELSLDARDTAGGGLKTGPRLRLKADGQLRADRDLLPLAASQWYRLTLRFGLGERADGKFSLTVGRPDGTEQTFAELPVVDREFRKLDWFGFISDGQRAQVVYLDDVELRVGRE